MPVQPESIDDPTGARSGRSTHARVEGAWGELFVLDGLPALFRPTS